MEYLWPPDDITFTLEDCVILDGMIWERVNRGEDFDTLFTAITDFLTCMNGNLPASSTDAYTLVSREALALLAMPRDHPDFLPSVNAVHRPACARTIPGRASAQNPWSSLRKRWRPT